MCKGNKSTWNDTGLPQFMGTFTVQRITPSPPSKSQHYYWFIACFFEDTAYWQWGVLRFPTFSHRLPPTLDSPKHPHTPSAPDDCLGLPLSLELALYFLWWCTNKIQEEDNHKQKDDRDNGWRSLLSFWVFLCMYRPIIHKKVSVLNFFSVLFFSGLSNSSFCILKILTRL